MNWVKRKFARPSHPARPSRTSTISSPARSAHALAKDLQANHNVSDEHSHIPDWPNSPKVQFMSELHLEKNGYDTLTIPREAPYLLLMGDIGLFRQDSEFLNFLRQQCNTFDLVMLVLGNHEFYGVSHEKGLGVAQHFEAELEGKLVILNRRSVEFPAEAEVRTVILGCTLHSHIPADYRALTNDFLNIHGWTVAKHNAEHRKDRDWLRAALSGAASELFDTKQHIIIATHYAPSYTQTCHPDEEKNALSHCFRSNTLDDLRNWKGAEMVFA